MVQGLAREQDLVREAAQEQARTEGGQEPRARGGLAEGRRAPDKLVPKNGKSRRRAAVTLRETPDAGLLLRREFAADEARGIQPQVPWLWKRA